MVRCTVLVNSGKLAVNTLANAKMLILVFTPAIQSNFFHSALVFCMQAETQNVRIEQSFP